jgi:hypothetical protein
VGDATLTLENSDSVQFAVFGAEVFEQPPALA